MKRCFLFLLTLLSLVSCIAEKGEIAINIKRKATAGSSPSSITSASVSSVQVINNQLVINGAGLSDVSSVVVNGNALNENFSIETKTATTIIANSIRAFNFDVSKVFNLILSDASASATFSIDFSLCNATLNGKGFNCATPVSDKDVLSYDAVSGKWKPRPASGLNYLGTFDASSNPASGPAIGTSGAYYVISDDGLIGAVSFSAGDWLVSNGSAWQKIDNSTAVLSVFGRSGAITAQEGDYNLNLLTDVNIPTTPATGKVLKFDGTHWVAGDDLSGGGAGSVTTSAIADGSVTDAKIVTVAASKITGAISSAQIADGSIVNADINAAAAIDYSKLNIPAASIPYAKLNIADGDIPAAKISGLTSATSVLATTIVDADSTHAPDGNAVFDALGLKLNLTGGTLSIGTISGVPTPTNSDDVANKGYTDTRDALKLTKAGDTMSGVLTLDSDLKIKGGSNYVTVKGHATSTAYDLVLPANKGTSGYVLSTDGNGNTSWVDVTSAVTSLDTDDVAEASRLYFTEARVLGTDLAGLNTGVGGAIAAADTVLGAMGKLQYQVTDLKSKGQWDKNVNDISYGAGNVEINTKLRLKDTGSNFVELKAPATVTTTYTLTLPANDGNVNQVLRTDGAGVLTWVDVTDASVQAFAKAALPTCAGGEVLKSNGTSFSCVADNAGAGAFSGTASKAVVTNVGGTLDVSATTSTELGYVSGVTSSIQTQLNNKEAAITAGTALQYLNGLKNFVTLDTLAVPENTRLYFTESRVLSTDLSGFVASNSAITAADSVLSGFEKSQGQITNLNNVKANVAGDTFTGDVTFNTQVRLKDGAAGAYVTLKAPATGTVSHTLTLPGTVGTNGQVLSMTGTAGVLAWTTPSSSSAPNGAAGGDLSGSYPNPTITGLDATKLATGLVDNTELNYLDGVTSSIQTQLTGKQSSDATLTALAGFNTNGIMVQTAADTFVGRSIAGTANRVAVTNGDGVAGNPTVNISTTLLPSPVVGDVGKFLKVTAADTSVWTALGLSDITTALGFTPVSKAGDSLTSGTFTFSGAALLRTLDPVGPTDVANKQYVDSYGQWSKTGSDLYRLTGNVGIGTATPGVALDVVGTTSTTKLLAGDGAFNAPSITFASNPNTGLSTDGNLRFSVSGGLKMILTGSALDFNAGGAGPKIQQTGGNAALPSYAFNSDADTGMFNPNSSGGSNELGFSTAGVERIRIDPTGLVGVGTTTPKSKLDVNGAVRVGVDATACSATIAGAMRFNTPNVEFCNGTAWAAFGTSGAAVASSQITDGTITDADVNAGANITATKLGTGAVDNTEFNYLDGVTSSIQTQLTGKQASDATLTALAAYNTNGILVQTAADTFVGRSIAGTANRVAVTNGDGISGNPTINVSTTLLPSPVVGDVGKYLKATAADTSVWTALSSSDITTALGFTPINKAGDSLTTGTITLSGSAVLRSPDPVGLTDVANKQYVDSYGQWTKSGSDIYRSGGKVAIGTTTPVGTLSVEATLPSIQMKKSGAAAIDTINFVNDMDATGIFWISKGAAVTVPTSPNKLISITNEGNVEIYGQQTNATTDASGVLALKTQASGDGGTKNEVSMEFYADRTNLNTMSGYLGFEGGTAFDMSLVNTKTGNLIFGTDNAEKMRISSTGFVGIGSNNPTSNLYLIRTAATTPLATFNDNTAANNFSDVEVEAFRPGVILRDKSTSADDFRIGADEGKLTFSADLNDDASKGADSNYNDSTMMTIMSSGNVGIGTNVPAATLHVQGTYQYNEGGSSYSGWGASGPSNALSVNDLDYNRAAGNSIYRINNHTGISMSAHTSYGGIRFYNQGYDAGQTNPYLTTLLSPPSLVMALTNGRAGVGTTAPLAKLQVNGTTTAVGFEGVGMAIQDTQTVDGGWARGLGIGMNNKNFARIGVLGGRTSGVDSLGYLYFSVDENTVSPWTANAMVIKANGFVGIGTTSPDDRFVVNNGSTIGRYTAAGWTHSSDVRLKHDIKTLDNSLEKILKLRGVNYVLNADPEKSKQIGFIAQEVEPLFPEVVKTDKDGYKSMVYSNLIAPLVEAFKDLYKKITESFIKTENNTRAIASIDLKVKKLEEENAVKAKEMAALKKENAALKNDLQEIKKHLKMK
ncbi:tail fiber domain-containing protein [Bacteriovorax sp. PP10]|uniref:Tail fiber domain-containing protein n=1 Tax=Bacteriovorax antarcticus TaxID=3088717 RepID=A0ABU5VY20_9BACT|nr:tail fiber domain-containing protein [Bacteriovorax sp. PP10]MEA9357952.1 tail fiber domain-containing protein [Bacteriovorax sp. PP10]